MAKKKGVNAEQLIRKLDTLAQETGAVALVSSLGCIFSWQSTNWRT
jgi:hypothetical protein